MSEYPSKCPSCNADLWGEEIPPEIRHNYEPPYRWSRVIGISDRDSIHTWMCRDCGHEWPRTKIQGYREASGHE